MPDQEVTIDKVKVGMYLTGIDVSWLILMPEQVVPKI